MSASTGAARLIDRIVPSFCIALWLLLAPLLALSYLRIAPSPDQALFDYIAWAHLHGDIYYAGVAEQNWPGAMFLHEWAIRLFGTEFWTWRAFDFLLMQIATLSGALLLWRAGLGWAPWIVLLVYPAIYVTSGAWFAGQRDIYAAGFLLLAAALSLGARRRNERPTDGWGVLLAGAAVGAAVLVRPTYLSFLVGLAALELLRFRDEPQRGVARGLGRIAALLGGFALIIGLVVLAGWLAGALDDFYIQSILFNTESYQQGEPRGRLTGVMAEWFLRAWHWQTALAGLGLLVWLLRDGLTRALVLVLGLGATGLLSFWVQNKGFGYHLGAMPLVLTLLMAAGMDGLARGFAGAGRLAGPTAWPKPAGTPLWRGLSAGLLCLSVGLMGLGLAKRILDASHWLRADPGKAWLLPEGIGEDGLSWNSVSAMVARIDAETPPDGFVLQWGRSFQIPYLAERRPTLRFVSTPALTIMTPAFSAYQDWMDEIAGEMIERRPAFAIVGKKELDRAAAGQLSAAERLIHDGIDDYRPVLEGETAILLQAPESTAP
ncbi:MAG: hypothetical protein ACK5IP_03030 [Paracoccus sp. (in: a-proteobacteria)]